MWHRWMLMVWLVGAVATPAVGQQAGMTFDERLRQDIEAVFTRWLDAFNRGDGKAAAAFFVPHAPAINPRGMVRVEGQDFINRVELHHQQSMKTIARIDRVQAVGSDVAYAVGPWTSAFGPNGESQTHGIWLQVYERHGDVWQITVSSVTRTGGSKSAAE